MTPPATQPTGVRPIKPEPPRQSGTPHISLTSDQILAYLSKIINLFSAGHNRYEQRPLNTTVVASNAELQGSNLVQPQEIQVHPKTPDAATQTHPIIVKDVFAFLYQISPSLGLNANTIINARNEQKLCSKGAIA